jgi:hypothetical protein
VALWQGNQIDSLSKALNKQRIKVRTQDGSFVFKNLKLSNLNYTIGFGVTVDADSSICTTLLIPKDVEIGDSLSSEPSTVALVNQGTNSLIAHFHSPPFNLAKTKKNWIALFRGRYTSNIYSKKNFICYTPITNNTNEGDVAMNDIPGALISDEYYTIVYGMGLNDKGIPAAQTIVAATTFKGAPRQ